MTEQIDAKEEDEEEFDELDSDEQIDAEKEDEDEFDELDSDDGEKRVIHENVQKIN